MSRRSSKPAAITAPAANVIAFPQREAVAAAIPRKTELFFRIGTKLAAGGSADRRLARSLVSLLRQHGDTPGVRVFAADMMVELRAFLGNGA